MFHEEKAPFQFTPKNSFVLGLVAGVLVLCTLGFFVLLTLMLRGSVSLGGDSNNTAYAPVPTVAAAQPQDNTPPAGVGEVDPINKTDYVRGGKNATVTLIEYSDYQCPYCGKFHPTMLQLMKEYGNKVKWTLRSFPLSFHPEAVPAANAALCAGEQGKFWEYSDDLFLNQANLAPTYYPALATTLKLNKAKFDKCFADKKYQARITAEYNGGSKAGVTGTPGTIIIDAKGGKQLVPGAVPYEQLKAMVDAALAVK